MATFRDPEGRVVASTFEDVLLPATKAKQNKYIEQKLAKVVAKAFCHDIYREAMSDAEQVRVMHALEKKGFSASYERIGHAQQEKPD